MAARPAPTAAPIFATPSIANNVVIIIVLFFKPLSQGVGIWTSVCRPVNTYLLINYSIVIVYSSVFITHSCPSGTALAMPMNTDESRVNTMAWMKHTRHSRHIMKMLMMILTALML